MSAIKILVINPGSTSTKLAYFVDDKETYEVNLFHEWQDLKDFKHVLDQLDYRLQLILTFLGQQNINVAELDVVVGRGGILPPVDAGAYEVNEAMVDWFKHYAPVEHPSNLGALLALAIKEKSQPSCRAMIYDPVSTDQFHDLARVSGLAELPRKSMGHMLNMRAVALKTAKELGREYQSLNLIVVHLGSGNTLSLHSSGKMIDIVADDEGPFSVERSGRLSTKEVIHLASTKTKEELTELTRRKGGLISHLQTNDGREIEARIEAGDEHAKLIYEALAYQVAKGIGELATVVNGQIDRIILTGGLVNSKMLTDWIVPRVSFISEVSLVPGENELAALSGGAYRVLQGQEPSHTFSFEKQ